MAREYLTIWTLCFPIIENKSTWRFPPDVMYFDEWPVRQPSLLFAGLALNDARYIALWKKLNPEPMTEEGFRNFPIRQLLLWMDGNYAWHGHKSNF